MSEDFASVRLVNPRMAGESWEAYQVRLFAILHKDTQHSDAKDMYRQSPIHPRKVLQRNKEKYSR